VSDEPRDPPPGPSNSNGKEEEESLEVQTYTVPEAAQVLGVGRTTLYSAIQRGEEIPGLIRIGKAIRISKAAVRSWLGQLGVISEEDDGDDE
jgi:excisionase family DNA binding protein